MLNIDEIKKIPAEEFKDYLHSWMDQKEVKKELQMKLRKQLVTNFQKTELAKKLETGKQKHLFSSKDYVIDALQAEHLYQQQNHFTLSVFFTESRHTELLPNFEKDEHFRFDKTEIGKLIELLGKSLSPMFTHRLNLQNYFRQASRRATKSPGEWSTDTSRQASHS